MPVIIVTDPAQRRAGRFMSMITIPCLLLLAALTALAWATSGGLLAALVAVIGLAGLSWRIPQVMRRRFPGSLPEPDREHR